MINILLIISIINYLIFFTNKKNKYNKLYCGIFAWSGNDTKLFNFPAFNLLGTLNEVRGEHSCGISVDNNIKLGIDKTKMYRDFSALDHKPPNEIPIVLGHTRQASLGFAHTIHNAHPFGFGNNKDSKPNFIGVHNGTIHNYKELAKEFNIDTKKKYIENNIKKDRIKIDSEILLESIYKNKKNPFEVLEKYLGAAALIFYDTTKDNIMYVFRGASKETQYDNNNTIYYERPLYYYKESKNSLYISSIKNSLLSIGGIDKETVFEFEANKVYKIKDGNIDKSTKYIINRDNCFHEKFMNFNTYGSFYNHKKIKRKEKYKTDSNVININTEETRLNQNKYGKYPYFNKFRYFRNGHLITGIYIYIKKFGFYLLGNNETESLNYYKRIKGREFKDHFFKIIKNKKKNSYIPFPLGDNKPKFYFFFEGIMLKDLRDYNMLIERFKMGSITSLKGLSEAAVHPIISLDFNSTDTDRNIYLNGKKYSGEFAMKGGDRIYKVENGNLISKTDIGTIKLSEKFSDNFLPNPVENSIKTEIIKPEKNNDFLELNKNNKMIDLKIEKSQNKLLLDALIEETFMHLYEQSPYIIKKFEKFYANPIAELSIEIIEDFNDKLITLINLNEQNETNSIDY